MFAMYRTGGIIDTLDDAPAPRGVIRKLSHLHEPGRNAGGATWRADSFFMTNGWIKLHRKLLDNPVVMRDGDHLAIWTWILLHCTHESRSVIFRGKSLALLPGQRTVGRKEIAGELKISESKVQRVLKFFESEQLIEQLMSAACRLISVKKWKAYQGSEQPSEQLVNSSRTASEQLVNTKEECKKVKNDKNILASQKKPSMRMDGYPNCRACGKPEPMCSCEQPLDKSD
jgi:hypothetical protein